MCDCIKVRWEYDVITNTNFLRWCCQEHLRKPQAIREIYENADTYILLLAMNFLSFMKKLKGHVKENP